MTSAAIDTALYHMARQSMRADAPVKGLPPLKSCRDCTELFEFSIDYKILTRRWIVVCGCSNSSGEHRSLRAAILDWNKRNAA